MKKWLYVVAPACMLAVFLFFYFSFAKELEERDRVAAQKAVAAQVAEAARKADIEQKARLDAERHAAERAAENARKEQERIDKWNAVSKDIQDQTDAYNKEADGYAQTVAERQQQLEKLRKEKEEANRAYLEALKDVELARVNKRTAEMEIQRMTDMIAARAAASAMATPPAPPAPSRS